MYDRMNAGVEGRALFGATLPPVLGQASRETRLSGPAMLLQQRRASALRGRFRRANGNPAVYGECSGRNSGFRLGRVATPRSGGVGITVRSAARKRAMLMSMYEALADPVALFR